MQKWIDLHRTFYPNRIKLMDDIFILLHLQKRFCNINNSPFILFSVHVSTQIYDVIQKAYRILEQTKRVGEEKREQRDISLIICNGCNMRACEDKYTVRIKTQFEFYGSIVYVFFKFKANKDIVLFECYADKLLQIFNYLITFGKGRIRQICIV